MKKIISVKFLVIIISLFAVLSISLTAFAKTNQDQKTAYESLMENQRDANAAHSLLMSCFEAGPDGYVYPDTFAGDFIVDNRLTILLANPSDADIQYYSDLLGEYIEIVDFKNVKYSYNELKNAANATMIDLSTEYNVNCCYVDIKENCARVKLDMDDYYSYMFATPYINKRRE